MKFIIDILFITIIYILSSIGHEQDIAKACKEKGNSGGAGWTVKIQCKEMLSNPDTE